jgi:hypothetical protein
MKKYLFITIVFCFHLTISAQPDLHLKTSANEDFIFQMLTGEAYSDPGLTHKGIYFQEAFLPGKVKFNNGDSVDNILLRYNGFEDQLIWLSKDFGQVKLDKAPIAEFELNNSGSASHFKNIAAGETGVFVQICYEGKVKLYVQRKIVPHTDYIKNGIHYYKYKSLPQYFLMINNRFFAVNRSINSIYQLFPAKKEEIRRAIRGNNLKDRNEDEFIKLISQIEDLLI